MPIIIFFIAVWYLSLFSQTFFHHRYASHGAFKMSRFWEKFFYIFSYITQGSSYMSPRAYAMMHRMHHAYTDTPMDPHSPNYSSNLLSMMMRTRNFYREVYKGRLAVEERFTKNLPDWPAFERIANSTISRIAWVIIYTAIFVLYANSPFLYLLLPVVIAMGAFHGAIINWFAHKFGYKNFILRNTSENLFRVDIFMLGESYHNNHHKRPSSINFGVKWYELDPVYPVILFFNWLHIIRVPKITHPSRYSAVPE